jgi:uncharacterized damage-inducible protein DinB
MREIERISDELQRACAGDPWHGPSVAAVLEGVDVTMAAAHPINGAHSICELVLHLTAWTREVTRRLRLGMAQDPEDGDWSSRVPANAAEWSAMVAAFHAANAELEAALAAIDDTKLDERIGDVRDPGLGSGVSRYVTLHGLAQHHAYHAGQITLLKNAQRR